MKDSKQRWAVCWLRAQCSCRNHLNTFAPSSTRWIETARWASPQVAADDAVQLPGRVPHGAGPLAGHPPRDRRRRLILVVPAARLPCATSLRVWY